MYPFLFLRRAAFASLIGFSLAAAVVAQTVSVTTEHYDTNRTGANLSESILTTSNVSGGLWARGCLLTPSCSSSPQPST